MLTKSLLVLSLVAASAAFMPSDAEAQAGIKLRPGDQFELRISGVPPSEMSLVSQNYRIADDGTINLHLINRVKVADMTVSDIQRLIESTYKNAQYYTNPTITINVQAGDRFVTVGGDVKAPSRVPYTTDLTILSAINSAGGFTEFAKHDNVRLLRGDKVYEVDVRKIRSGQSEDIPLAPGDKIEVQRSFW